MDSLGKILGKRVEALSRLMKENGWDAMIAGPSPNFLYLSGISLWRSERLIAAIFKPGRKPVIILPAFEAERAEESKLGWTVLGWGENDDPYAMCAGNIGKAEVVAMEEKTPFSEFDLLRQAMPGKRFVSAEPATRELRRKKSPAEADAIRKACAVTVSRIGSIAGCLNPGMSEREASEQLEVRGLLQFGPSSAIPHAEPGENRLKERDVVIVDTADTCESYTSDLTRTIFIGEPEEEMIRVYNVVKKAQEAAIEKAAAGVRAGDVDSAARRVIEKEGYGPYFTHRTGHGLGLEVHEPPYMHGANDDSLREGDVVTIEPGIYLPGRWGVRIEDDVLIKKGGCELLSVRETEMTVIS